ncbi:zyg-11-like protein B [Cryptotermes secundus]|uniref:Zyg-11-like protein B n=1 Tax=Cryptotermes secundus TaxID=105785 RepID=A0A2J7PX81_9NEOP|nr:protein zyg-11 homolog isoform X2 [Cryptotermes secundus]PNF20924.1 zyg-11-like protein B [Cryptotermes secundus]
MYDSPRSLQEACVDFICENLEALCEVTPVFQQTSSAVNTGSNTDQENSQHQSQPPSYSSLFPTILGSRLTFKDGDVYFHSDLSEKLLTTLSEKGKLSDLTMTLFDSSTTSLRHVQLRNARMLTTRGLRVLKGHKISNLEATGMKVTVNDLIGCLGEWTLQNLRSLNVARSTFMDGSRYCVVVALSKLRNLQSLNVSCTEFNRHGLEIVAEDLPQLESLDISCTRVDDISPLRKCRDRLKSLTMYNLKVSEGENVVPVLLELHQLRVLDISDEKDAHPFEMFHPTRTCIAEFLKSEGCMVHLTLLDISGKDEISIPDLRHFLGCHRQLKFLGLIHSEACYDESFVNPHHPDYNPNLVVTGIATESQLLEALRRYTHRPVYVQKCLYNLFRLTPNFGDARVDVIQLVLPGMEAHPGLFGIQMAATACLYNLSKGDLAQKIHPKILKQVVELTLTAMENFPNNHQLQKNTLLTLCSDRILQDVAFDKYRCARLVMNCLCAFDDPSMNRMSVAICSILAAKISTSETSLLGSQPQYMRKLLSIVRCKVQTNSIDITIKFTLSALWNLTDESPTTCSVFLEEGGMDLFLEVLMTFQDECAVETKVLGLINNIAEVSQLRPHLMVPGFMSRLRKLLHSDHIDVSYFAAGIIAHLASDGADTWMVETVTRQELLEELGEVVLNWETPEGEMVAYRSFHPFFPLLTCHDAFQVQLWAVWAIQHVCTKNAKRYCPMLMEEGGSVILHHLHNNTEVNPNVRDICQNILEVLAAERYSSELLSPQM